MAKKSEEKFLEQTFSATQLAALLGVSTRSVRGYAERGLLDRNKEGRYPLGGLGRYFEHRRAQAAESAETHALTRSRADLAASRAAEVKLRLDRTRAEFVDRESAAEGWRAIRQIVEISLLALAERTAGIIPFTTVHDRAQIDQLTGDVLRNVDEEAFALGIIGAKK